MVTPTDEAAYLKLAEVALRYLRLDGTAGSDKREFHSRALSFQPEGLVIEAPTSKGQPVELATGDPVVCFCQLGNEVLRFSAEVAGEAPCRLDTGEEVTGIVLGSLGEPTVAQRRQHHRISLSGTEPVGAVIWVMEMDEASGRACVAEEIHGHIVDISTGGICMTMNHVMWVPFIGECQLWVRVMLPAESESLLFRARLQHVGEQDPDGHYRVGLEFTEAVEPGQHQLITHQLANFIARQDPPASRAG